MSQYQIRQNAACKMFTELHQFFRVVAALKKLQGESDDAERTNSLGEQYVSL